MAIAYSTRADGGNTAASSFTATTPTHNAGDLLLLVVAINSYGVQIDTPSGYQLVGSVRITGTLRQSVSVFWKVGTGSTSGVTVSLSGGTAYSAYSHLVFTGSGFSAESFVNVQTNGLADSSFRTVSPPDPGATGVGEYALAIGSVTSTTFDSNAIAGADWTAVVYGAGSNSFAWLMIGRKVASKAASTCTLTFASTSSTSTKAGISFLMKETAATNYLFFGSNF